MYVQNYKLSDNCITVELREIKCVIVNKKSPIAYLMVPFIGV